MATKWKNTAKRLQGFVKLHWTQTKYILGALLLILALWMFYVVIIYRTWHTTGDTIFYGIVGNIFIGTRRLYDRQHTAEADVRRHVDAGRRSL